MKLTALLLFLSLTPTAKQLPEPPDYDVKTLNNSSKVIITLDPTTSGKELSDLFNEYNVDCYIYFDEIWVIGKRRPLTASEWHKVRKFPGVVSIKPIE